MQFLWLAQLNYSLQVLLRQEKLLSFIANAFMYQVQSGFGVIIKSARSEKRFALYLSLP